MFQSHRRNPFIKSFVWPYCEMQVGPRTSQPHPCYLIFYLTTAEYRFYIWLCLFVVELCCFIFTFFSLLLIYLSGMKKNIYGNLIKTHHSHGMHLSISEANKKRWTSSLQSRRHSLSLFCWAQFRFLFTLYRCKLTFYYG